MIRCVFSLAFLFSVLNPASAQGVSHFVYFHQAAALNKQISMGSYAFGWRRICFNVVGGVAKGTDDQFLGPDQLNDSKAKQKIRASQTIDPENRPANSYLESCNSTYSGNQVRFGFTLFLRRDDTLGRHPFTGLHVGVDAVYMFTHETQTVVYKSESDETRNTFSGSHSYSEIGAATHVGYQVALFNERLYIDLRAVIPFYYPFMPDPNLNSPFAGTKYEAQIGIGWHFTGRKKDVKDDAKEHVRKQI
jgi:hypothetical protein